MKTLKVVLLLLGFAGGGTLTAIGQGFVNFDFESAVVHNPAEVFQDWSTAAPGWSHSSGADTAYIYYGAGHTGSTQEFFLLDSKSVTKPLDGSYSLAVTSGFLFNDPFSAPWINAHISQTGTIPDSAHSIRLLAVGPVQVLFNGTQVPMYSQGGNAYVGDISSFAGASGELKFLNAAALGRKDQGMIIDNIVFSSEPVPEPGAFALLVVGFAFLCWRRVLSSRRGMRCSAQGSGSAWDSASSLSGKRQPFAVLQCSLLVVR